MSEPSAPSVSIAPSSVAPTFLTRDEIIAAPDGRRYLTVPVDEWKPGAAVRVSSLSSEMQDLLERFLIESRKTGGPVSTRAYYCWMCIVGPDGTRLFTDPSEVQVLANKSAAPIDRIFRASLELNDVSEAAVDREAGNSASEGSDTSSSPSPSSDSAASPASSSSAAPLTT